MCELYSSTLSATNSHAWRNNNDITMMSSFSNLAQSCYHSSVLCSVIARVVSGIITGAGANSPSPWTQAPLLPSSTDQGGQWGRLIRGFSPQFPPQTPAVEGPHSRSIELVAHNRQIVHWHCQHIHLQFAQSLHHTHNTHTIDCTRTGLATPRTLYM